MIYKILNLLKKMIMILSVIFAIGCILIHFIISIGMFNYGGYYDICIFFGLALVFFLIIIIIH